MLAQAARSTLAQAGLVTMAPVGRFIRAQAELVTMVQAGHATVAQAAMVRRARPIAFHVSKFLNK